MVFSKARAPHRGDGGEARKIVLGREQQSSKPPSQPNQEHAARDSAAEQLSFHPLADLFPLMKGAEFDALVADIKANGLRDGIVLYENKILDGRNRYRACEAAGVTPGFRIVVQSPDQSNIARPLITDPTAYVISANLHRRHLTAEQKRELTIDTKGRKQPAKRKTKRPPTEDDFHKQMADQELNLRALSLVISGRLATLREFAKFIIARAKSVSVDPGDLAEWKVLLGKVKAILEDEVKAMSEIAP